MENNRPGVLQAYLADVNFVHSQMHTRMQGNYQLMAQGILLFTVILTVAIYNWKEIFGGNLSFLLLFIPIPFYFLFMIQIREDILMFTHDRYFLLLRENIIQELELPNTTNLFTFLSDMKKWKSGNFVMKALSLSRYSFLVFSMLAPISIFIYLSIASKVTIGLLEIICLIINVFLLAYIPIGFWIAKGMFTKSYDQKKTKPIFAQDAKQPAPVKNPLSLSKK